LLWIIINITCFLGTRCSHRNPYKATCLELQVLMRCLWVSTALCALLQQEVVTETLRLTAGVQTTGDPSSRVAMWSRRSIGVTTPNTICLWQVQPSAFSGETVPTQVTPTYPLNIEEQNKYVIIHTGDVPTKYLLWKRFTLDSTSLFWTFYLAGGESFIPPTHLPTTTSWGWLHH